jgi:hypothetical protein
MKKNLILASIILMIYSFVHVQPDKSNYPDPEFNNEIYLFRKDSVNKFLRLEKNESSMNTKTKLGGSGGSETGYTIDGEKSSVRLMSGENLSFIYFEASDESSLSGSDTILHKAGISPEMMAAMNKMMDPTNMISLYKTETVKEKRKIYLAKSGGALPFSGKKSKSSQKYPFSVKKIRERYWQLVIDKNLPKGEYAFVVMGMGMASVDGGGALFVFGID